MGFALLEAKSNIRTPPIKDQLMKTQNPNSSVADVPVNVAGPRPFLMLWYAGEIEMKVLFFIFCLESDFGQ